MEIKQVKSRFLRNIFDQNTYVLISGDEAVIIDAGAEIEDIAPLTQGKRVLAVLLTHVHFDHIWNIEKYVQAFDCDVYVCEGAESGFLDPEQNASLLIKKSLTFDIDPKKIKYYPENLRLGSFDFKIINTPGHTWDSVCLLIEGNLFSGDTVFADTTGRTDLKSGDEQQMQESLKKIEKLDYRVIYPGHFQIVKR